MIQEQERHETAGGGPNTAAHRLGIVRPAGLVWVLIATGYLVAFLIYLLAVRPNVGEARITTQPWPLLAIAFAIAEIKVVDVHFRGERHAFSLTEVPGVIGLFVLTPGDYLLALSVGVGAALLMERRQTRIRRTFNLGNTLLVGLVTLGSFTVLGGGRLTTATGVPLPEAWLVTGFAVIAASTVGTVMVAIVITLSGGAPQIQRLGGMLQFGVMVALANTSIALVAVLVLATLPLAILLLTVPVITVYFAYRAYISERAKHERLELLYESSRILQLSPELDASVLAVVAHAREIFQAEICQIIIFPDHAAGQALTTTSVHDGPAEVMVPERPEAEPELWRRVRAEQRAFFWRPAAAEVVRDRRIVQAMVSPLTGEGNPLGMLLVANHLAEGVDFDADDLRLLETVSNQVGVTLENGQLERSLSELSDLKEELRHQAYHDALTGLPNRALLAERVALRAAQRSGGNEPVVMFLDLDDFKLVNDTLGHAVGDQLLIAVSERIREHVRGSDLAARLGGDEFGILLGESHGLTAAISMAERLIAAIGMPFALGGREVRVGVSVGIAAGGAVESDGADDLLRNADVAMYTAKSKGKGRLAVFDPLLHAELIARHELSSQLTSSLGRGELVVYYQPIVELVARQLAGVEALVRWRHPERGIVCPDDFIHLAEENGSIVALGAFVLEEACRQTVSWRERMAPETPFSVSVNVSPHQLQGPEFVQSVTRILRASGLDPRHLVLEMTESGMLQDTAATVSHLSALRQLGVRVAMDDFGTGYSSLSYLRRFPIDMLKIARDFIGPTVDDIDADADEQWAFARAIVALGQTLRLAIVAEGIEQESQLARLTELGCALGQGYYFSRPVPAAVLEAELAAAGMLIREPAGGRVLDPALAAR